MASSDRGMVGSPVGSLDEHSLEVGHKASWHQTAQMVGAVARPLSGGLREHPEGLGSSHQALPRMGLVVED